MEFSDLNEPTLRALRDLNMVGETSTSSDAEAASDLMFQAYLRDKLSSMKMYSPPFDVQVLPDALVVMLDVPGIDRKDIKVKIEDGNTLVVSGERRRFGDKPKDVNDALVGEYVVMERRMGKFLRKLELPEDAKKDGVTAAYQDGVLKVTVGRRPLPKKQNKTIEIKVG